MKKIILCFVLLVSAPAALSCAWDPCDNLMGDCCGCTVGSQQKTCMDAVNMYISGPYQGMCAQARANLKPLYCP